jgi:DNA-binding SARP family transcriptional activator
MMELQSQLSKGAGSLEMVFELATLFQRTGKEQPFQDLTRQVLGNSNVPPQAYLKVAELSAAAPPHLPLMAEAFNRYLQREPADARIWMELACVQATMGQADPAIQSLRQAVALGGETIKDAVRKDPRFDPIRNQEAFQRLTAPSQQNFPAGLSGFIP